MPRPPFAVRWSEQAIRDLEELALFVARESSPQQAAALLDRVEERARALETLPDRGRHPPELARHGVQTFRELVIRPWRLIYRVSGRDVYVLALLDARRDLADLLLERLVRPEQG